jgi:hypothetical protein
MNMTKMINIDIETSGIEQTEANEWVSEIANVYADVVISDVHVSGNRISCKIGLSGMDDTQPEDIKMKIEEYLAMNEAFSAKKISCH